MYIYIYIYIYIHIYIYINPKNISDDLPLGARLFFGCLFRMKKNMLGIPKVPELGTAHFFDGHESSHRDNKLIIDKNH